MSKKITLQIVAWLAVLAAILISFRSTNSYVQSIMCMLMYNIVLVLGLNFITGLTGQMNLATIGMLALGAYTYGILTGSAGWNSWVALFAMFAVGFAVGKVLGYPSLRLKGFYLSLTTIGFGEIVRLLAMNMESLTGGTMGFKNIKRLETFFYHPQNKSDYFYLLLVFTVIAIILANRIVNSKWGRAYKAIRDNSEAAEASGIDISKLKIQAFTLAAIFAAIGGAMYAGYNRYLNPSGFTLEYSQNYIAMLMIGGIGTVPGCIIGAIIVTVLPELLRGFANYYWILFCTVCIVMAILVPEGLWPLIRKLFIRLKMALHKREPKAVE
ncbi:MAG: branched-chain amino acid ABC transporter permease [Spirochaetes bacterium]|nr:branched-chain amino acid ABC transporter permease [Spirochaetota bacterium]